MTFNYEHNGQIIEIEYSAKDFVARSKTDFGELKYALHMMLMCPRVYTEEMIRREYCQNISEEFEKIITLLKETPDFIENSKKELSQELEPLINQLELLKQKKKKYKKLFKNGEIPEFEYVQVCSQIREKTFEISMKKRVFFNCLQTKTGIDLCAIRELILEI